MRGLTRGDGRVGEDVTANLKTVRNLPLALTGDAQRHPKLLEVRGEVLIQRDAFEASIERMDGKYREDIATLEKLMLRDEEIARLQERILEQVSSQLEQGVATSTDYITQANALAQARLNRQLHELQQQQIKVEYLTLKGQL